MVALWLRCDVSPDVACGLFGRVISANSSNSAWQLLFLLIVDTVSDFKFDMRPFVCNLVVPSMSLLFFMSMSKL